MSHLVESTSILSALWPKLMTEKISSWKASFVASKLFASSVFFKWWAIKTDSTTFFKLWFVTHKWDVQNLIFRTRFYLKVQIGTFCVFVLGFFARFLCSIVCCHLESHVQLVLNVKRKLWTCTTSAFVRYLWILHLRENDLYLWTAADTYVDGCKRMDLWVFQVMWRWLPVIIPTSQLGVLIYVLCSQRLLTLLLPSTA